MPEGKKKKPAWLTGEPEETRVAGQQIPRTGNRTGGRKGPLAEDDTGELLAAGSAKTAVAEEDATANAEAQTNTIPRVGMPGAGSGASVEANAGRPNGTPNGGNSAREIFERLRENPMPLLGSGLALAVIIGVLVIVFGGGGGDPKTAERGPSEGAQDARQGAADPFAGGPVSDSGVAFEPLRESGGAAALTGAGLEWSGSVTEKGDGRGQGRGESQGQTLTLDGPTAAQLERGFDIGDWDVEPGVYAVANEESGEVLHVTTQTLVPQEETRASEERTLGTVYAFEEGEFTGFAYYLDTREPHSDRITRTYFGPSIRPYRVAYRAPDPEAEGGDRNGAFVPLLVGWRGFQNTQTTGEEE
jgi:hypothetical protein